MLNTGFSEITEDRVNYNGKDPWYMEIAITGKCNFSCKYCNRFSGDIALGKLTSFLRSNNKLRHIQITGGEPTIHKDFKEIVNLCRENSIRVGLSTNGSDTIESYKSLPIDMFSISLDDYDLNILRDRGYQNPEHIIDVIKELSKIRYVNIGLIIDNLNFERIEGIIDYILNLGVNDIKLSVSSKCDLMPSFTKEYNDYPILNYRVENFKKNKQMRGRPTKRCHIMKNDITIVGDKHYPCLVYFREHGEPIGMFNGNMIEDRIKWSNEHDCCKDLICSKYCMDFKCDFNKEIERKGENNEN